ncbi:hypothetical protein ABK040_015089 [Willaertia magna]
MSNLATSTQVLDNTEIHHQNEIIHHQEKEEKEKEKEQIKDKYLGSILGLAIGDSYGTTFEFISRNGVNEIPNEMIGGGKFKLMKGMFTDDTSLALLQIEKNAQPLNTLQNSLQNSLQQEKPQKFIITKRLNEENGITLLNGKDLQNKFLQWYRDGHFSSNGECFDIGKTTVHYLLRNEKNEKDFCTKQELNDNASGNGVLMRLSPITLYFYGIYLNFVNFLNNNLNNFNEKLLLNKEERELVIRNLLHLMIEESGQSNMTTHPSEISIDACRYFAALLIGCLQNVTKQELFPINSNNNSTHQNNTQNNTQNYNLFIPKGLPSNYWELFPLRKEVEVLIKAGKFIKEKTKDEIKNGGYVIDALEASLFAFYHTSSFKEGCQLIIELGDDCDTIAAIFGQIAGAYYGFEKLPKEGWYNVLVYKDLIRVMALELMNAPPFNYYNDINNDKKKEEEEEKKETEQQQQVCSVRFKESLQCLLFLEEKYKEIHRRSKPCPKQFKTMKEFNDCVQEMEDSFMKMLSTTTTTTTTDQQEQQQETTNHCLIKITDKEVKEVIGKSLLNDFKVRCEVYTKPPLESRLERSSLIGGGIGALKFNIVKKN